MIHPVMFFLIPVLVLATVWLVHHPEFTLLMIGFTSIIKGFMQEQFPIFETLDFTFLLIIIFKLKKGVKCFLTKKNKINNCKKPDKEIA